MKKRLIVILSLVIMIALTGISSTGCEVKSENTVDKQTQKAQEESLKQAHDKINMPKIKYYTEKNQLSEIYELCDSANLLCYLYTKNEFTGKYVFEGYCKGFGVPFSTQFSNPEKPIDYEKALGYGLYEDHVGNIAQAEPNGLFKPDSSSATWIIKITERLGSKKIQDLKYEVEYYEPGIVVTQSKKPRNYIESWSLETYPEY